MAFPINTFILLVVIVGVIFLQIHLSKRESKWPGLVLPILSLMFSLISALNVMAGVDWMDTIITMIVTFLAANIPTVILLAIYLAHRSKIKKNREIDKMTIQDLD